MTGPLVSVLVDVFRNDQIPVYRFDLGTIIRTYLGPGTGWEVVKTGSDESRVFESGVDIIFKSAELRWDSEEDVEEILGDAMECTLNPPGVFRVHVCFSRKKIGVLAAYPGMPCQELDRALTGWGGELGRRVWREATMIEVMNT